MSYYEHHDVDAWATEVARRIGEGDLRAIDEAIGFLERDPYHWRSGYVQERIARLLARTPMSPGQRSTARTIVLSTVDGGRHCPQPGIGKLAGAVADNELRRALRARLHAADPAVARRALTTVVHVRHPGFTAGDLASARAIVLAHAGEGTWLPTSAARHAKYLWTAEWAEELRSITKVHGPDRNGAKRLLALARRPDE